MENQATETDMNNEQAMEPAGFGIRLVASIVDTIVMMLVIIPALTVLYGMEYWEAQNEVKGIGDILLNYVFPIVFVLLFWVYRSATPGKMLFGLKIVDADSGGKLSTGRLIGRYFGYYLSMIPIFLGFIWVLFDRRKQGFHDKIVRSMVVRHKSSR